MNAFRKNPSSIWSIVTSIFLALVFLDPVSAAAPTEHQFVNKESGHCLASQGDRAVSALCQAGETTQKWRYLDDERALVDSSGNCLDASKKKKVPKIKACNGKKEQQWTALSSDRWRNKKTGHCLAEKSDGSITTEKCGASARQQWPEFQAPQPPAVTDSLINGAHGQCLNAGNAPFVDVRNCDDTTVQQWSLNSLTQQLQSADGQCVTAVSAFNLVSLERCNSDNAQRWQADSISNNLINVATGQCLDVWGGELDNEVGVWTCDGSARQVWRFANAQPPQPPQGSINIVNLAEGQCINTGGATVANMRDCDTETIAQKWLLDNGALKNSENRCITATAQFDLVSLATCTGDASQQWRYDAQSMNYTNASTGQCLDVWGGVRDAELAVWTCDGSARQQFQEYKPATAPSDWEALKLQFDGLDVGVDNAGQRLFLSLGAGYQTPRSWTANVSLDPAASAILKIQGQTLNNGGSVTLPNISYGSSVAVERFENDQLKDQYTLVFTNLPVVQLQAALITDEPKREGRFRLSSGLYAQNTGEMKMGIEIRGATSQLYPKKSYSVQIGKDDDWADERKLTLLGMRKDGDWILDATYRDTTFVRNIVNHDIYRQIHPYVYKDSDGTPQGQPSIRGELVELILNGSYHGVYVLSEKVDRKLLDLSKIDVPEDANGNELWDQVDWSLPENGSVLYKAEFAEAAFLDAATYRIGYEQKYPDSDDVVRWEPLDALADFIINSSNAEFSAQVGDLFDLDSLVDYWALVLTGQAQDNTQKNFYLSRNENGKYAIITWDFDATFGMFWDGSVDDSASWFFPTHENRLFERLLTLPQTGFNAKLKARWNELRASLFTPDTLAQRFQAYIDQTSIGGARDRNMARWPGSGGAGSDHPELGTSSYIRDLLVERLDFVDRKIAELP